MWLLDPRYIIARDDCYVIYRRGTVVGLTLHGEIDDVRSQAWRDALEHEVMRAGFAEYYLIDGSEMIVKNSMGSRLRSALFVRKLMTHAKFAVLFAQCQEPIVSDACAFEGCGREGLRDLRRRNAVQGGDRQAADNSVADENIPQPERGLTARAQMPMLAPMRADPFSVPGPIVATGSGVREFLTKTYAWMAFGLFVTGAIAWGIAQSPDLLRTIATNRTLFYVMLFGQLGLVIAFSAAAHRASTAAAAAMFVAYAALTGVTFSTLFVVFTRSSIASTFFVTGGTFGALSLYGMVTKRDLSGVGRFMMFGLIGLIIASVVNIFLQNPAVYWISTYAGVLIFAGLTAYDTQKLVQLYRMAGEGGNLALRGALMLYLDFINLFLMLLRLFGNRRD